MSFELAALLTSIVALVVALLSLAYALYVDLKHR